jgi:hypothetical protein
MNVLVMYQEIPEDCHLLLINMTPEEFEEVKAAHENFCGCYRTTDHTDAISQALCRWSHALNSVLYSGTIGPDDHDKEWMAECGISFDWYNRFSDRAYKLTSIQNAGQFDAFINTGYAM